MGWRDILGSDAPRKERKYGKEPRHQGSDLSGFSDISGVVGTPARDFDDVAADTRRQRLRTMLAEQPGIRYAVVVDNPDADPVIVALAIREVGTCEIAIPAASYDAFVLLAIIEWYGGTLH